MELNKIKNDNNFYYYQTNEFVSIILDFGFAFDNTIENLIKAIILSDYLFKTNNVYKTHKEINDKKKELYGINSSAYIMKIGKKTIFNFAIDIVDPKIINEDYFDDALHFFKTIIEKPNFINNKLDENIFLEVKNDFLNKEKNDVYNPKVIQKRLFYNNVMIDNPANNYYIVDIDFLENFLNKLTSEDIISFYHKIMKSYVRGYVFGNISDNEILKIKRLFNFENKELDNNYYFKQEKYSNDIEIVSKDTTQSFLYVVYDIKNFDPKKQHIYQIIEQILNGSKSLLYKKLRTELGVSYLVQTNISYKFGYLYVYTEIDKENKEKALKGIEEAMHEVINKEIIQEMFSYAKERIKEQYYSNSENLNKTLIELEKIVYDNELPTEKIIEKQEKLEIEDIIKELKMLDKKCVYFYKGDKNV